MLSSPFFIDGRNIELDRIQDYIKNAQKIESLCNNVNGNLSSMGIDLVELLRLIIISIEGWSNEEETQKLIIHDKHIFLIMLTINKTIPVIRRSSDI